MRLKTQRVFKGLKSSKNKDKGCHWVGKDGVLIKSLIKLKLQKRKVKGKRQKLIEKVGKAKERYSDTLLNNEGDLKRFVDDFLFTYEEREQLLFKQREMMSENNTNNTKAKELITSKIEKAISVNIKQYNLFKELLLGLPLSISKQLWKSDIAIMEKELDRLNDKIKMTQLEMETNSLKKSLRHIKNRLTEKDKLIVHYDRLASFIEVNKQCQQGRANGSFKSDYINTIEDDLSKEKRDKSFDIKLKKKTIRRTKTLHDTFKKTGLLTCDKLFESFMDKKSTLNSKTYKLNVFNSKMNNNKPDTREELSMINEKQTNKQKQEQLNNTKKQAKQKNIINISEQIMEMRKRKTNETLITSFNRTNNEYELYVKESGFDINPLNTITTPLATERSETKEQEVKDTPCRLVSNYLSNLHNNNNSS